MHWSKKSVIKVQFVVMSKCQAKGQKRKSGEQEMDWCLVFFSTIVKVHVTVTVITVKCMLFAVVNVKVLHSSQSVIELFSLVQKSKANISSAFGLTHHWWISALVACSRLLW